MDLLLVESGDEITALESRFGRWRILDGRDDFDQAVLHRHFKPEAAELALGLHLHIAELLRIEIGGMRIEGHQHAIDCRLDQLVVIGLLDIVGAHALQDLAEKIKLLVDLRVGDRG